MSTKTFNRRPQFVNGPSGDDVKDYYFNHFNWKGMSTDKNFLAADQETFEQCNNVYADEEGILRSRPAIQISSNFPSCERFWLFGDTFVYLKSGKIYFPKKTVEISNSDNITLIQKNNKIFVFATSTHTFSIDYYDMIAGTYGSASDYIYVPNTKTISNVETDAESKNLLSDKTITTYLYDSLTGVPIGLKDGDSVKITIDGTQYDVTFDVQDTPRSFFERKSYLSFGDDALILAVGSLNGKDIFACLEQISGAVYISYDAVIWTILDTIPNYGPGAVVTMRFSKDGLLLYTKGLAGIWVIDTVSTVGKYNKFTAITRPTDTGYIWDICFVTNTSYVIVASNIDTSTFRHALKAHLYNDGEYEVQITDIGDTYPSGAVIAYLDATYDASKSLKLSVAVMLSGINDNTSLITLFTNSRYSADTYQFEQRFTINNVNVNSTPVFVNISNSSVFISTLGRYNFNGQLVYSFDAEINSVSINGKYLMTPRGIYDVSHNKFINYLNATIQGSKQIAGNNFYYIKDNILYSSDITTPIPIVKETGTLINNDFLSKVSQSFYSELNAFYLANDKILYINEERYDDDGNFLWYFPEYTKQEFAKPITKLFPISANEMAIFFDDEIWYSNFKDGVYTYYKSKLPVGLKNGSDVVVSYDGSNIIFATQRGLAALSYQDFVASSEQTLTFLSDPIHKLFKEFVKNPVKICRHQYWYICYSTNNKVGYMFDVRNSSWWPLYCPVTIDDFFVLDNELLAFKDGRFLCLNKTDDDYKDRVGNKVYDINWNFKSQKLHLNAINYNKHIANITLYSVLDSDDTVRFKMEVNNYRKKMDVAEIQTIEYKVDAIRTFVKRVSYFKVNEFQYNMHQDDEDAIKLPLSLSGITVKYRISGEVR